MAWCEARRRVDVDGGPGRGWGGRDGRGEGEGGRGEEGGERDPMQADLGDRVDRARVGRELEKDFPKSGGQEQQ